jgi:hypothetical protein
MVSTFFRVAVTHERSRHSKWHYPPGLSKQCLGNRGLHSLKPESTEPTTCRNRPIETGHPTVQVNCCGVL